MDVMPDCAPVITGRVEAYSNLPDKTARRWRIKSDFKADELSARRDAIREKAGGQNVKTFVSDQWTLEYDLAYAGLGKDVWVAAKLAGADDQINSGKKDLADVVTEAEEGFALLDDGRSAEELASHVYALFTTGTRASKAVVAQYLANRLEKRVGDQELNAETLKAILPPYLMAAIEYVTGRLESDATTEQSEADG